jgi:hypothetical protein
MKSNLKLKIPSVNDLKLLLPILKKIETPLVGLALVAIFAYTAYIVQLSLNVKATAPSASKVVIRFDQPTLDSLKSRTTVDGSTPLGTLGKSDPFGN